MNRLTASVLLGIISVNGLALGADAPDGGAGPLISVRAQLATGKTIAVPSPDKPTVLVFVKADQPASHQALRQIPNIVKDPNAVQVVLVISGDQAPHHARGMEQNYKYPWPVAVDPDYSLSGKVNVHVWPTTVVINPAGQRIAFMPGVSKLFADHLDAYIEVAAGKITAEQLKARLSHHGVVGDSPDAAASRHLQVARAMMEKGRTEEARHEFNAAYKLSPKDPVIQVAVARGLVAMGQTREALLILEKLPTGGAPAFDVNLLRAKALISRGRWEQAKEIVPTLVTLNPNHAEAQYLMGMIQQSEKDYARAAESFRKAFEGAAPGARVPVSDPSTDAPATGAQ